MIERPVGMSLAALHLAAGVCLLLLSGWFIAASALAGLMPLSGMFNYVIPAAVIRFLALIRIAAGYGEKYLGHAVLLEKVNSLRLAVFDTVMLNTSSENRARELERVGACADALASRDITVLFPLVAATSLAALLALCAFFVYPPLLIPLALAVLVAVLIGWCQWRRLYYQQQQVLREQAEYCSAIEHHLATASLWSLGGLGAAWRAPETAWCAGKERVEQSERQGERCVHLLSLSLLLVVLLIPPGDWMGSPLLMLGLFFCLSVPDWLTPPVRAMSALAEVQGARETLAHLSLNDGAVRDIGGNIAPVALDRLECRGLVPQRAGVQLPEVNLELQRGQVALIEGSSGSGKSSLLQAIAGLLPMQGLVELNGEDAAGLGLAARRWNLMYMEQFPCVLADSLRQNLLVAAPGASDEVLASALRAVGLEKLLSRGLDQWLGEQGRLLSGGEKKRLGVARLILADAPVWMLDEPFEGLDARAAEKLESVLDREREQRIVIIVSHQPLRCLRPDQALSLET